MIELEDDGVWSKTKNKLVMESNGYMHLYFVYSNGKTRKGDGALVKHPSHGRRALIGGQQHGKM